MFDRSDRPQISLSLNDPRTCLESLEPRLLLSTVYGGETFEFQDAQQQRIVVSVSGNVVVEIIGATVSNNDNSLILHQMPGSILTSPVGRAGTRLNGGFGGSKGSDPVTFDSINGAPIEYFVPPTPGGGGGDLGGDVLAVNALASNADGDTYGFNYFESPSGVPLPTIHLFKFEDHGASPATETPIADIGSRILTLIYGGPLPDTNPPAVTAVDAAAFNPVDGRLYFVVTVDRADQETSPQGLQYVFSIDVSGPLNLAFLTLQRVDNDGLFGDTDGTRQVQVHSIAFDQVLDTPGDYGTQSNPSSYMWAFYTQQLPDEGEQGVLGKFSVYGGAGPAIINTASPVRSTPLTEGQGDNLQPILSIRGIDFSTNNPTEPEEWIYAITNEGSNSSMLFIDIDLNQPNRLAVTTTRYGPVSDPDDPDATPSTADDILGDDVIRGESPGSLTWNPVLINPYTGRPGVFLFADTETDDLMYVSELQRFGEANAFFIYVTQGDPNGYITLSVATYDEARDERTLTPYGGSPQELRVMNTFTGQLVTLGVGIGGVTIGAVTQDLDPDDPEDDLLPLLQGSLSGSRLDGFYGSLGTVPAGMQNLTAGLVVARSLLQFDKTGSTLASKLLGWNMDLVEGLSASGDGRTLVLIDTDSINSAGIRYTTPTDEMAFYDTVTHTLGTPVQIRYESVGGDPLSNVQGLDYGGGFFEEKLFAIYDVDSSAGIDLRLGTIDTAGVFTPVSVGSQLDASIVAVQAMAFTPDQTQLYIIGLDIAGEARIYRYDIDPATGNASGFVTIGQLVDAASSELLTNFGSMDFTAATVGGLPQLLAHDRHNGRLVDISLAASGGQVVVGANVATEKGSLRPAVGAITYDRQHNRMYAVDNTFSQVPLVGEGVAFESAALMVLTGMTSNASRPQDLGKFLLGGTITGAVSISGSMNTFYAGWIVVGNARGQGFGSPDFPTNFFVGGDLLTLISPNSIGGQLPDTDDPLTLQRVNYATGLDMVVNGRLGMVRTPIDFLGSIQVRNNIAPGDLDFRYTSIDELEDSRWAMDEESAIDLLSNSWLDGELYWINLISETNYLLNYDTGAGLHIPQFLGALPTTAIGSDSIVLNGRLTFDVTGPPDVIDSYNIALMAGQTITLQLLGADISLFLFDPDGNVVASNYSRLGGYNRPFSFTTERPGVYRVGVYALGDLNFNGDDDDIEYIDPDDAYQLRISGLGNLAFGGLSAGRHIYGMDVSSPTFEVDNGDLGALWAAEGQLVSAVGAGSLFFYAGADPLASFNAGVSSIRIIDGNLRAMQASNIGLKDFEFADDWLNDPEIEVWSGNVGMIRSGGFMSVDIGALAFFEDVTNPFDRSFFNSIDIRPIGGDVQFIDAGVDPEVDNGEFWGNIRVNGSIGVIRADSVNTRAHRGAYPVTSFEINASGTGDHEAIDLIDVRGDWGNVQGGGPALSIGGGGNIRFIRVGGLAFNDTYFGIPESSIQINFELNSGTSEFTTHSMRFVDDGGSVFYVDSLRDVPNPSYDPVNAPTFAEYLPNLLVVTALGVRHSGGVVVTSVRAGRPQTTTTARVNGQTLPIAGGVSVWSESGAAAEIGQIYIDHAARTLPGVLADNPGGATEDQWTVNVLIRGSTAIDVYDISSSEFVVFNQIRNDSGYRDGAVLVGGNLYNGLIQGVGTLFAAGNLGMAYGSTDAYLAGTRVLIDQIDAYSGENLITLYPMGTKDFGWVIRRLDSAPAVVGRVAANRAMGNLLIAGDVREFVADADRNFKSNDSLHEGIAGPIWVTNINGGAGIGSPTNMVGLVDIGEGIAPAGSGYVMLGGIVVGDSVSRSNDYASIGTVRNNGLGSDIQGAVIATGRIDQILLNDGALIGARIFAGYLDDPYQTSEPQSYIRSSTNEIFGANIPEYELGRIEINGRGGILGSYIGATDIGPISVRGGFGIISSLIQMNLIGTLRSLYVDGYGIRDTRIVGGTDIGDITLGGRGQMIAASPAIFTPSVFQSELGLSPFGHAITDRSDLHTYLGTSAGNRLINGVTDTGVIEDSVVKASNSLGNVRAYQIRTTPGGTDEPSGLTSIQIANRIASIQVLDNIDGLNIVTGEIKKFQPGADVSRLQMSVAGPIQSIVIRGSLLGNSSILAAGDNGYINQIQVSGDVIGSIEAFSKINKIQIGGNLTGNVIVHGQNLRSRDYALGSLTLGGSLLDGSLDIAGNANQIKIAGGLGVLGDELRIRGSLRSLTVGTDRSVTDASIELNLIVDGDLGTLNVNGAINGQVLVGGTLGSLVLTNRTGSPIDLIAAPIAVHGDLKTVRLTDGNLAADLSVGGAINSLDVRNGNVAADVTAGGSINRFNLTNGSILAGATVTSSLGDIKNLSISGGDLLGEVRAPNGQIQNLSVRGSDIGPAALVQAMVIRSLKIDGTVQSGASILASGAITSLIIGGDIQSGVTLTAGSAKSIQVGGDLATSMTIGGGDSSSSAITVGGDLGAPGSLIDIATGATVRVGGAILAGSVLSVDGDLQLQATGDVAGDVIAGGKIQRLTAGSLTDAAVVAGYDITALTVSGAVTRSLVQAGASQLAGSTLFDAGTARSGEFGSVSIGSVVNSILAAGGNIKSFKSQSMTGSTLSSGLVLAGAAIDQVRDGTLDLSVAGDRNTARQGVTLIRGDILSLTGGDLVASQVSAGVDPGADGDFATDADNTVLTSRTGGASFVKVQSINLDAASRIVADGVIDARSAMGAGEVNNASVTYTVADLTTNNPLSAYLGTATANTPYVFTSAGARTVTITLTGPGSVDVYDEVGFDTDLTIGSLVLTGTTSSSSLVITTSMPGDVAIGRVLAADDTTIGRFSFDGDLVGDGTDDPDFWVDGSMNTLSFRNLGDDLAGRVGGAISTLSIQTQGSGSLVVGGKINNLIVVDSSGTGIFGGLATSPLASIRQMTTSDAGATWVFDTATRKIGRVDLTTGALVGSTFSVTDPLASGAAAILDVSAMDFGLDSLSATRLLAVANILDLSPTVTLGDIAASTVALRALAVNASGQIFAIDSSSGTDHLVRIDPATGGIAEDRGQIRDIFGNTFTANITALAFDASDVLYGVTSDLDGNGSTFDTFSGAAMIKIETSASAGRDHLVASGPGANSAGIRLNAGGFTGSVRGMVARPGGFYIVVNTGFGSSLLTTQFTDNTSPTPDTVSATLVGAITAGGATGIVGMGYDANGNLLGLSVIGGQAAMVKINTDNPLNSSLVSSAGVISPTLDAFAVYTPTGGGTTMAYAYDTDAIGGRFLTSPGIVATLGTITTAAGPTQGQFDRLSTLVRDALGTPLGEAITAFAVAPGDAGHVFVVTDSGLLYEFDQNGQLQNGGAIGAVLGRGTGQAMHIVGMDFNAAGDLVGLDSLQNRLVTISLIDALATPRTDSGVVPATGIYGLSFDPINDRFAAFRSSDNTLVELLATTQAEFEAIAGGIIADSINRISITGSGYAGRIATTGNTIGNLDVQGDFAGRISASSINSYNQRAGDFSGALTALGGIKQFQLAAGSILADGFVQAGGAIGRLSVKGDMAGSISAHDLSQLSVTGDVTSAGRIAVTGELGTADVRGDFDGTLEAGSVRSNLKVGGALGATGRLSVDGDVQNLQIANGVAAGGAIVIDGSVRTIRISQTFAGTIDVRMSVNSAGFGTLSGGRVGIGTGLSNLTVSGDMLSSVISVGAWLGPDGLYNTADDVIVGGSISRASIRGAMTDSAVVAGVLPDVSHGPGLPANKTAYVSDSAEAGGILTSVIGNMSVNGLVSASSAAAADGITRTSGAHINQLNQAVLTDPAGMPTVVSIDYISDTQVRIIFSEPITTGSIVLSVDADGDGSLASPADVVGSVTLRDSNSRIMSDVTLSYTTLTDSHGDVQGVLIITRSAGLFVVSGGVGPLMSVNLTASTGENTLLDRSGSRSGLLDWNLDGVQTPGEDALGSVTDVDGDGTEGGSLLPEFLSAVIASVPAYEWWFGCTPTAVGMLMGYYDQAGYINLMPGNASTQTDAVNEAIASSGNGFYINGDTAVTPGTPGSGHIPDYALYGGNAGNDEDLSSPIPDMSELDPTNAHANDSIADFLGTSRSSLGLEMGGTWGTYIAAGVMAYFTYRGYTDVAAAVTIAWGSLSWDAYTAQIDADQPVLLSVDSDGNGTVDHTVLAIGYDRQTHQYACHRTWETDDPFTAQDEALFWYDFTGVATGVDFGINQAVFVSVA
ncbi:MAG: hypothetical protein IT441_04765 [Phycisphaeraceae bacterium]|nr:hypothetical protein [Phycisphaeraceae bacterium]